MFSTRIKKLFGNSVIFAFGNLGTKMLMFIMVPFYTRYLNTSDFGTVDLIMNTVTMLTPLLSLSVFDAVFRFTLDSSIDNTSLFTNGIVVTCAGSIITMFFSLVVQYITGYSYCLFLGLLLIFNLLMSFILNFVRGIGRVKLFTIIGILFAVMNAILNIIFLKYLDKGISGYFEASIISSVVVITGTFFFGGLLRYGCIKQISLKVIKEMLTYSIPLMPNAFAWWFTTDASRYFILFFVGTEGNGLYAVANKVPALLTLFFSVFSQAWQISAVEEFNSPENSKFYNTVFNALVKFSFIGVGLLILFVKSIIKVLAAPSFYDAWKITPFLLLAVLFSNLSSFLGTTYIAAKRTSLIMYTTFVGMILNAFFNIIFIPLFGTNGAGIGSTMGFLIVFLVRLKSTSKIIQIRPKFVSEIFSLFIILVMIVSQQYFVGALEWILSSTLFIVLLVANIKEPLLIFTKRLSKNKS